MRYYDVSIGDGALLVLIALVFIFVGALMGGGDR